MRRMLLSTVFLLGVLVALPASAEEFLIGCELPLSGSLARSGQDQLEGIQTAIEVANQKAAPNRFKLICLDNESSPAKAVAAVEKLASQGVLALTGGYGSPLIGPASDAASKYNLVYITSGGASDELNRRGLKNIFRINNNRGYIKSLVGFIQHLGAKNISLVYSTKEATADLAKESAKQLVDGGVKVTMHPFDPSVTDFKPVINKIRVQDKPELLVMSAYENDYVGIIRAAKVLKPDVKAVVGVWSLATSKMAADFPDLLTNVFGNASLPYPAEFTTPAAKEFAGAYQKLHKKLPDYIAQNGYSHTQVLLDAILRAHKAGTLKSGGILEEVRKTDRDTLMGHVQFDAVGDNNHFIQSYAQHQNGKIVLVWPKAVATGAMKYPSVPW